MMSKECVPKNLGELFYNAKCPLASFFVWIALFTMLYFLLWMPDQQLELDQNNKKVKVINVDGKLRAWLVLSVLIGGVVGWFIVCKGCMNLASSQKGGLWNIVWFLVALVVLGLVVQVLFAYAEKVQLSTAGDVLRYLEQNH